MSFGELKRSIGRSQDPSRYDGSYRTPCDIEHLRTLPVKYSGLLSARVHTTSEAYRLLRRLWGVRISWLASAGQYTFFILDRASQRSLIGRAL